MEARRPNPSHRRFSSEDGGEDEGMTATSPLPPLRTVSPPPFHTTPPLDQKMLRIKREEAGENVQQSMPMPYPQSHDESQGASGLQASGGHRSPETTLNGTDILNISVEDWDKTLAKELQESLPTQSELPGAVGSEKGLTCLLYDAAWNVCVVENKRRLPTRKGKTYKRGSLYDRAWLLASKLEAKYFSGRGPPLNQIMEAAMRFFSVKESTKATEVQNGEEDRQQTQKTKKMRVRNRPDRTTSEQTRNHAAQQPLTSAVPTFGRQGLQTPVAPLVGSRDSIQSGHDYVGLLHDHVTRELHNGRNHNFDNAIARLSLEREAGEVTDVVLDALHGRDMVSTATVPAIKSPQPRASFHTRAATAGTSTFVQAPEPRTNQHVHKKSSTRQARGGTDAKSPHEVPAQQQTAASAAVRTITDQEEALEAANAEIDLLKKVLVHFQFDENNISEMKTRMLCGQGVTEAFNNTRSHAQSRQPRPGYRP